MKTIYTIIAVIFALAWPVFASAQQNKNTIKFAGYDWSVAADTAEITWHKGKKSLYIVQGSVWLDNAQFSEGVIEFDVAHDDKRGFSGVMWHSSGPEKYEEIYFRTHLSGKPDAVQYAPVENGNSSWQIFTDEHSVGKVDMKFDDWNHVKIVVKGDSAELYYNSLKPVLVIPDLKSNNIVGDIGLRAIVAKPSRKYAYFTNFTHRPLRSGDTLVGKPSSATLMPNGLIQKWQVSSNVNKEELSSTLLPEKVLSGLSWKTLVMETNGIVNLSKLAKKEKVKNTVLVKVTIHSDVPRVSELKFGYSDKVRLFVNGKLAYSGEATWRSRDKRFYGTVGLYDSIGLDLKKGNNEIVAAVSERFGGWAFMGAIEDQTGLKIIQ